MAVEILEGSTTYTQAADVFSFAVLFSELFTGTEPYSDRGIETSWALIDQIIKGLRPTLPHDFHKGLRRLIIACWDRDPARRLGFDKIVPTLAGIMDELQRSEAANVVHAAKKKKV